jgi:hypothetical protein
MFSAFFIKRPRFSFVISIVIVLVDILALFNLPIALYPEVTPPQITVKATYPGASAEVIARTVGIPLESEINGVEDMLYMNSSSQDSAYTLTVTFKTGVDPDIAQVKVQNRLNLQGLFSIGHMLYCRNKKSLAPVLGTSDFRGASWRIRIPDLLVSSALYRFIARYNSGKTKTRIR